MREGIPQNCRGFRLAAQGAELPTPAVRRHLARKLLLSGFARGCTRAGAARKPRRGRSRPCGSRLPRAAAAAAGLAKTGEAPLRL